MNDEGRPPERPRHHLHALSTIAPVAADDLKPLPVLETLGAVVERAVHSPALDAYVDQLVADARRGRSLTPAEAIIVDLGNGWIESDFRRAA